MQVSNKSPIVMSARGLRFLDLVVNQNKLSPKPLKRRFSLCETFYREREEADSKLKKPKQKDYLQLSSQIKFNPDASPSSSILSRREAHPGSSPLTSSSTKRKRVGFRDPVSSTKEYLITEEEERQKSRSLIRSLKYEGDEEVGVNKENIIQVIEETVKETKDEDNKDAINVDVQDTQPDAIQVDHDYDGRNITQNTDAALSDASTQENTLTFRNQSELMDYVIKNLPVDELLKKLTQAEEESLKRKELISKVIQSVGCNDIISEYFKINDSPGAKLTSEQNALITNVTTEVSKLMQSNEKAKHKVLGILSENHSKAFLDHALQENSPNAVCSKIALPNIVNFLIHKLNVDDSSDNDKLVTKMNSELIRLLINNTSNEKTIVSDRKEVCELMELLFKNKELSEIIEVSSVVLRKFVEKH